MCSPLFLLNRAEYNLYNTWYSTPYLGREVLLDDEGRGEEAIDCMGA
jgi:hypothetical protein